MRSMIRRTIKAAFRRPDVVIWSGPQAQRTPSPGVKNRFRMPVKMMMNNTGLRPFTRAFSPTRETRTQAASTRAMRPYARKLLAVNRAVIYSTTSRIFVRGSSLWATVFPGKYWPRVMSFNMGPLPS